jgi:hypothetical protein
MKPMTIISVKHPLMQFFSDFSLQKIAFGCGFTKRVRNIEPRTLILCLISALSIGKITSIAQLHQKYNGMCPTPQRVSYRPFYNQLRKPAFEAFIKIIVRFFMAQWVEKQLTPRLNGLTYLPQQNCMGNFCWLMRGISILSILNNSRRQMHHSLSGEQNPSIP